MLLREDGGAVLAIGQTSHAWISGQLARAWGNALCPCLHSDPVLPDCPPGQTVRVQGVVRFYEGDRIEEEVERVRSSIPTSARVERP